MKIRIARAPADAPEEILIRCHDPKAGWVSRIIAAAQPEKTVIGFRNGASYSLPLRKIYYFEVVDGRSFLYGEKTVYETRLRLYEFEQLTAGEGFFRCGKSMVLNAAKVDHVVPALSGRFTAVLLNGEKAAVSRLYVGEMKKQLGL